MAAFTTVHDVRDSLQSKLEGAVSDQDGRPDVPFSIRVLCVLIGLIALAAALAYPEGARPGVIVAGIGWVVLLSRLKAGVEALGDRMPRFVAAKWLAVAVIPTLVFVVRLPFSGAAEMFTDIFVARPQSPAEALIAQILMPLLILAVVALIPVVLVAIGGGLAVVAVYKTSEKAVYALSGSQLKRQLHQRGYHWITLSDAEHLVKTVGRPAFRLPECEHVGILPGYREGEVESLVPFAKLLAR